MTSMGTATSHRKSSRSSVGTSLTSAPLGTSTRTSEEGWGLGEREGRLTSPPGFSFLLCKRRPLNQMIAAEEATNVARGSYWRGRLPAVAAQGYPTHSDRWGGPT